MSGPVVEVEHSTDGGKTWAVIEVHPRSIAAGTSRQWADEFGNTYRPVQRRVDPCETVEEER